MDCKKVVLKNNLRVLLVTRYDLQSVLLNLWVKTGSRFEEDKKAGLSHFLEHVVFKGSKKGRQPKLYRKVLIQLALKLMRQPQKSGLIFILNQDPML